MEETKINAMLLMLQQQRDSALNQVVQLVGQLALLEEKIKEIEKTEEV